MEAIKLLIGNIGCCCRSCCCCCCVAVFVDDIAVVVAAVVVVFDSFYSTAVKVQSVRHSVCHFCHILCSSNLTKTNFDEISDQTIDKAFDLQLRYLK